MFRCFRHQSTVLEIETVDADLPRPSTVQNATETPLKPPSANSRVPNLDYPNRSALILAPDPSGSEGGPMPVRAVSKPRHALKPLIPGSAVVFE
jgi:hypothetical protein